MPFLKDFLFCFTGKILGCRIILHDMGQYLRKLYDDSNKIAKGLIRKLLRITTASIVLGEVTRRTYEGFIEKERTFSVHGSVEDFLELDIGEFPKEQNGRVDVLYFSFLSVSKGLFTALKSIPQVIAQNPNIFFTFCGPIESDSLSEEMERFIKEHHLRSHIRIIGYISDSKKRTQLFRTSDIFIFPTHRDVFGLVLLHAMAEGLPIVASNEGAIPEIVENGRNGYLFKKEDSDALAQKILFLAENPHLREKISKENRKRYLEFYTPQKYGARMVEVFQRITLLI
jgi:glycosyltransferase involved in cell wall biosynthesis